MAPPLNESRYLDDLAKPRSDAWKHGPRISLDDMISRTGFERVDLHAEARGGGSSSGARQDSKAVQGGKTKQSVRERPVSRGRDGERPGLYRVGV
jgi:hypothetical protein